MLQYLIMWNFRDMLILQISGFEKIAELIDANNKGHEHNMTWKLTASH